MARRKAGNRERGAQPGLGEDAGPWPRAWGCDGRWRGGGCGGRLFAARLLLHVPHWWLLCGCSVHFAACESTRQARRGGAREVCGRGADGRCNSVALQSAVLFRICSFQIVIVPKPVIWVAVAVQFSCSSCGGRRLRICSCLRVIREHVLRTNRSGSENQK